jgi:hypothetical protein
MMDDQALYLLQRQQLCENGLFIIDWSVVYFMLGKNGEITGQAFTDLYVIILQGDSTILCDQWTFLPPVPLVSA